VAIADLLCVALMQGNLVYVGVFFIDSKLYTISVLASLNFRDHLRHVDQMPSSTTYPLSEIRVGQWSSHTERVESTPEGYVEGKPVSGTTVV